MDSALNFDLLCEVNGVKKRLPFNEGKNLNPIGIFPFKETGLYLLLNEFGECERTTVAEDKIPTLYQWMQIFNQKEDINCALMQLKKPVLNGNYFARQHNMNWIVLFSNHSPMPADFFEKNAQAKIRYSDVF